jgi:uncharacterized protein YqgC (DUF456 family)
METTLTATLVVLALLLVLTGFFGCLLPIIPGPPLSYMGILVFSYAKDWEPFGLSFLLITFAVTFLVTVLDYALPAVTARRYGASPVAVWGSIVGLFLGLILFPPFGIFVGGFAGAVLGEFIAGRPGRMALRSGWGVFAGNILSLGMKMAFCGFLLFYVVIKLF